MVIHLLLLQERLKTEIYQNGMKLFTFSTSLMFHLNLQYLKLTIYLGGKQIENIIIPVGSITLQKFFFKMKLLVYVQKIICRALFDS